MLPPLKLSHCHYTTFLASLVSSETESIMANHASSSAIITIVIKPHSWPFLATEYVITPFDQSIDIDALKFKLLRAIQEIWGVICCLIYTGLQ
ncbi:hypothetical protein S83_010816 [Arachis hypogaea]